MLRETRSRRTLRSQAGYLKLNAALLQETSHRTTRDISSGTEAPETSDSGKQNGDIGFIAYSLTVTQPISLSKENHENINTESQKLY